MPIGRDEFRYVRMKTLQEHNMRLLHENQRLKNQVDELLNTLMRVEGKIGRLVEIIDKYDNEVKRKRQ